MANNLEELLLGEQPENEDADDELDDENLETDDEELGPTGKKALEAERQKVKELKQQLRQLKSNKAPKPEPADESEIETRIRAQVAQEYGVEIAREKALNLLTEFGYKGKPERGIRNLDLDSVVIDGKVDTEALRDVVTEWKEEEPQLFRRSRTSTDEEDEEDPARRRNTRATADLGRKTAPKTNTDPLSAALSRAVGKPDLFG